MKLLQNTLNDTAQHDLYYTDVSNLPKEVQDMILDGDVEFFEELGGGGTRVRINDIKIHGWVYDLRYTIDYIQDFDIHFQGIDSDDVEAEMIERVETIFSGGLVNNVYLEVVDNEMLFAIKFRNMHDASTNLFYFDAFDSKEIVSFKKALDNLDNYYLDDDTNDYADELNRILNYYSPKTLENINGRKMKKDEDSIDSEIYVDENTDEYYVVFNKVSIDIY